MSSALADFIATTDTKTITQAVTAVVLGYDDACVCTHNTCTHVYTGRVMYKKKKNE